jgi:hypothetical protein
MEELNLLEKLGRVKAPPGFERRVMDRLARLKQTKTPASVFGLRLSLAGGLTLLLICFLLVNVFVLQKPSTLADRNRGLTPDSSTLTEASAAQVIPVLEHMNYRQEVRGLAADPNAIYILENVSDESYPGIQY